MSIRVQVHLRQRRSRRKHQHRMKNLFFNPQPTSDTLNVTVETQSKRCQATIPVPQRTRRIQVNCPPVVTVSIGTQCSSLTDNVPLRVAAGLVPLPQQPAHCLLPVMTRRMTSQAIKTRTTIPWKIVTSLRAVRVKRMW